MVENAIGPDPVGPDLVLLKVALQRFAVERMLGEVTKRFFDSFWCGVVTILEAFGTRKQGHSEFLDLAGGGDWRERRSPEARGIRRGSARLRNEENPYGSTVRNRAGPMVADC